MNNQRRISGGSRSGHRSLTQAFRNYFSGTGHLTAVIHQGDIAPRSRKLLRLLSENSAAIRQLLGPGIQSPIAEKFLGLRQIWLLREIAAMQQAAAAIKPMMRQRLFGDVDYAALLNVLQSSAVKLLRTDFESTGRARAAVGSDHQVPMGSLCAAVCRRRS